jgi:uracil-DNA glycosylase
VNGPARLERWSPEAWPLAEGWDPVVSAFLASDEGRRLADFLAERLAQGAVIFPPRPLRALELTPLHGVRAVILGQDPYHGPGQAEGLAFSVAHGVKTPPSLRNIFREMRHPPEAPLPEHGSLLDWARRGVLLLNTSLTVEEGRAGSHSKKGWEPLTDALIERVAATASPCVYFLWGAHAQAKQPLIERTARAHGREALILATNHPSPLSATRAPVPFLGSGQFATAREWLADRGCSNVL